MHETEKPFVMYRMGLSSFKIMPRNAQGWRETILWVLISVPIIGGFIFFAVHAEPKGAPLYVALGLFTSAMLAWGIGGTIWMRRRSEIIDFEELLALKRERDAQKRRR
jgi:hypothetical protein